MLTRAELAAIRAVLEVSCGWGHPLTQRAHEEWAAQSPESTQNEDQQCEQ